MSQGFDDMFNDPALRVCSAQAKRVTAWGNQQALPASATATSRSQTSDYVSDGKAAGQATGAHQQWNYYRPGHAGYDAMVLKRFKEHGMGAN